MATPAISGNEFKDDLKVTIARGTTTSFQGGGAKLEKSFDGRYDTMYHSNWSNGVPNYWPITIEYFFAQGTEQITLYTTHAKRVTQWQH